MSAIVKQGDVVQLDRPFFSPEQEQLILDSFLNGAPKAEAMVLLEMAKMRKLNPFTRQIHFVKRPTKRNDKWVDVWAAQVGIDGFRAIAERTGKYAGQDEPEFEEKKDGTLKLCRVKVYRKDWDRPAVGVAYWDEYVQLKDGKPNAMWSRGAHFMLSKCAEAIALRKAFPEDLGGLYAPEEISTEEAPPTQRPTAKDAVKAKIAEIQSPKQIEASSADGGLANFAYDQKTGEVQEEPAPEEILVPFGREKGVPLSKASGKTLDFLVDYATKALDDTEKARWHDQNRALLEAIEDEIVARVAKRERE